jgi:hypothetical protein
MLPDNSAGGGGNGDGSLVAFAIIVNSDDKPLEIPAGRAKVDDLSITVTRLCRKLFSSRNAL